MLKTLLKKRISEDRMANIFVNSIITSVDEAFPHVAALINEDPNFEHSPGIQEQDSDKFLMVVFAGNLKFIPEHFEAYQDVSLIEAIYRKLAMALDLELETTKRIVGQYQNFCSRVNHPSKNNLYAMSKGVFFKYNLCPFQEEYFRNMKTPNPILLKKLDEIMSNFIFDWETYLGKFRVSN